MVVDNKIWKVQRCWTVALLVAILLDLFTGFGVRYRNWPEWLFWLAALAILPALAGFLISDYKWLETNAKKTPPTNPT